MVENDLALTETYTGRGFRRTEARRVMQHAPELGRKTVSL